MNSPVLPAVPDERTAAAVLPVYLGLYLVLLAFFVYFVAATAADRQKEAAVADDPAGIVAPVPQAAVAVTALRPLAEVFRPLALAGAAGDRSEPHRLEVAIPTDRLFAGDTATLRPELATVLDRVARALTAPVAGEPGPPEPIGGALIDEPIGLQVLIGLATTTGADADDETVADIIGERLAVRRAAMLARALLARGTPPETFAVGVAPGAGDDVRFLFRLDDRHAPPVSGE